MAREEDEHKCEHAKELTDIGIEQDVRRVRPVRGRIDLEFNANLTEPFGEREWEVHELARWPENNLKDALVDRKQETDRKSRANRKV